MLCFSTPEVALGGFLLLHSRGKHAARRAPVSPRSPRRARRWRACPLPAARRRLHALIAYVATALATGLAANGARGASVCGARARLRGGPHRAVLSCGCADAGRGRHAARRGSRRDQPSAKDTEARNFSTGQRGGRSRKRQRGRGGHKLREYCHRRVQRTRARAPGWLQKHCAHSHRRPP